MQISLGFFNYLQNKIIRGSGTRVAGNVWFRLFEQKNIFIFAKAPAKYFSKVRLKYNNKNVRKFCENIAFQL